MRIDEITNLRPSPAKTGSPRSKMKIAEITHDTHLDTLRAVVAALKSPRFVNLHERMKVFGSAATDKPRPGDIDLMVDFSDWHGSVDHPSVIPGCQALLALARNHYGVFDPFVRVGKILYTRDEMARSWIKARHARPIWKASRSGKRIDEIDLATGQLREAYFTSFENFFDVYGEDVKVYKNPSRNEFLGLVQNSEMGLLRAWVWANQILVWDAYHSTHDVNFDLDPEMKNFDSGGYVNSCVLDQNGVILNHPGYYGKTPEEAMAAAQRTLGQNRWLQRIFGPRVPIRIDEKDIDAGHEFRR